ncbi:MAG: alpha/beta fold hydrolase [Chitinispirillaceae bacterium]|nr:alpha/beta fold hydrolase [Chitinispirillaceae bacterium]
MNTVLRFFFFSTLFFFPLRAAEVSIASIPSASMNRSIKTTVIVPDTYRKSHGRFPVFYMLHGFGGNHKVWQQVAPLDSLADAFQIIFVCPNAGNSWYVNSPAVPTSRFETFIADECITYIDKHFRSTAQSTSRILIGTSMGGHGAITLLARHPERFHGAGSISGIMDLTQFPGEWEMKTIFGAYIKNRTLWKSFSAVSLIDSLKNKNKKVRLDCGTGDFALNENRMAHEKMKRLGIVHAYCERPGGHDARFVRTVIGEQVRFFAPSARKSQIQ